MTASGGSNPQNLGARPHGERGSASLTGSRGRAPSQEDREAKPPLKLKHFWFLDI